ncbi:hypothetical protein [Streptomyces sp. NPDC056061]|uniref:hypothetical protein n=1 Tax=Streptomyces sp. NPDC056061 TaxID=3345700 RepID=UPI0035DCFFA3
MFEQAPIYARLVEEQGDVPTQVRQEAERIEDDLRRTMQPLQNLSGRTAPQGRQPTHLMP